MLECIDLMEMVYKVRVQNNDIYPISSQTRNQGGKRGRDHETKGASEGVWASEESESRVLRGSVSFTWRGGLLGCSVQTQGGTQFP